MARFHCPYCSPKYQIHQLRPDGVMVCGHCGDPLEKVSVIRPTQVAGLVAAAAFIAPLFVTVLSFIQDQQRPEPYSPLPEVGVVSLSSLLLERAAWPFQALKPPHTCVDCQEASSSFQYVGFLQDRTYL